MKSFLSWFFTAESHLKLGPLAISAPPFITFGVIAFGLWSLGWIQRDAERRGKNHLAAIAFALLAGWPLSLLWWRWLRPPLLQPPPQR